MRQTSEPDAHHTKPLELGLSLAETQNGRIVRVGQLTWGPRSIFPRFLIFCLKAEPFESSKLLRGRRANKYGYSFSQ